ncbi:FHA domain-containing protein [Nocardia cyriacigeorgica]|uniref:FHA domain-containing protein n=1 Tax=Nocardia cyriacigeorgica TaxID=135487 RepID=UPI0018942A2D|nr:FHA domain-containing protein [Nocardia cyriacigeorgica]MBF6454713.1 FHA domain-containing protein [Nocardia cyriacigeorgica]MBF6480208.1 FHA domain-containing protein [Nocardia cyriacigeorgica]MBF6552607.1 FHA domain-containing protein [Nocardia cyriacigeorgica]
MPDRRASLAYGVPEAPAGTIHLLSISAQYSAGPIEGSRIVFGRDWDVVDICVGGYDPGVSRRHGLLVHRDRRWWLANTGRRPIRVSGSLTLFPQQEPVPLDIGYTPVFVRGTASREHLIELHVASGDDAASSAGSNALTHPPRAWRLSPSERVVLVALAQRYLLHDHYPQPVSWNLAATHLAELQPDKGWTAKKVEHLVSGVRSRLSAAGVSGLTREEVGEPIGNMLNHNLIRELLDSTTLVPPDLRLLDDPAE